MEWYLKAFKNYATFDGRSRRKEFWMFFLFNVIFSFVLGFVDGLIFNRQVLSLIYSVAIIIPSIAVLVRRYHDIGKSGWYYFILLIPIIGFVLWLIWMCTDSTPGPNQYGPNPKGV